MSASVSYMAAPGANFERYMHRIWPDMFAPEFYAQSDSCVGYEERFLRIVVSFVQ